WIVSGVVYVTFKNKQAKIETEVQTLTSEVQAYQLLVDDISKSTAQIEGIIKSLETIKSNLENVKNKMEKGEAKNESSQNR
ncbi:MAG TPA: hypothetical protein PLQ41_09670, partial [bacterium]|nr:hypothetical protein [bacterium]